MTSTILSGACIWTSRSLCSRPSAPLLLQEKPLRIGALLEVSAGLDAFSTAKVSGGVVHRLAITSPVPPPLLSHPLILRSIFSPTRASSLRCKEAQALQNLIDPRDGRCESGTLL